MTPEQCKIIALSAELARCKRSLRFLKQRFAKVCAGKSAGRIKIANTRKPLNPVSAWEASCLSPDQSQLERARAAFRNASARIAASNVTTAATLVEPPF